MTFMVFTEVSRVRHDGASGVDGVALLPLFLVKRAWHDDTDGTALLPLSSSELLRTMFVSKGC